MVPAEALTVAVPFPTKASELFLSVAIIKRALYPVKLNEVPLGFLGLTTKS
jgi:hypothetical protein